MQKVTDRGIEQILGKLLRAGVALSASVVLLGAIVYLVRNGFSHADYHVFRGEPSDLRTLPGIIHETAAGRGSGIIQLGLLLLIATPVARVVFSIWGFLAEKDRMYVIFTVIVLATLLYSLFGYAPGA